MRELLKQKNIQIFDYTEVGMKAASEMGKNGFELKLSSEGEFNEKLLGGDQPVRNLAIIC